MIHIIGAGPAGCYLGYLLAKAGKQVTIYEAKKAVGKPVQCTGIISKNLAKLIPVDKTYIQNKVYGAHIYSPDQQFLELRTKDFQAYIIDREKFDKHWLKQAKEAGCEVKLGYKLEKIEKSTLYFNKKRMVLLAPDDVVVGSDGPLSAVAKHLKVSHKQLLGIQVRAKYASQEDLAELYMGSIAPKFFAWIVPESKDIARIGIAGKSDVRENLDRFLRFKGIKKIIEKQAGLIPLYDSKPVKKGRFYLLGDAAGQVKATTGGGIIMGFTAAKMLSKSILKHESYSKLLQNPVFSHLKKHLFIRNILNKMTDKDYNELIKIMNSPEAKQVMLKYGDMDYPKKFLMKLILAKPSLLKFLRLLTK